MEFTFVNKIKPTVKVTIPHKDLPRLAKFPYFSSRSRQQFKDWERVEFQLPVDITLDEVKDLIRYDYHFTPKDLEREKELEFLEQNPHSTHNCYDPVDFSLPHISRAKSEYQLLRDFISEDLLDLAKKDGLGFEYDEVFDNMDEKLYHKIPETAIESMRQCCEVIKEQNVPRGSIICLEPDRSKRYSNAIATITLLKTVQSFNRLEIARRNCKKCQEIERVKELGTLKPACRVITMSQYILHSYWGLVPDNCSVDFGDIHRYLIEKMEMDSLCAPFLNDMFLNFLTNLKQGDYLHNLEKLTTNMDIFHKILEIVDQEQFMDLMGITKKMDRAAFKRNWTTKYFVDRKFQ